MKKVLLAFALVLGVTTSASAQEDVAAFYKGKTIRLVVGIGVGSGYDINARLLARHLAASTSPAIRPSSCRTSPAPAA